MTGNKFQILLISQPALYVAFKDPDSQFGIMTLYHTTNKQVTHILPYMYVIVEDNNPAKKLIPPEYHDDLVFFSEKEARILPPSEYINYTIPLTKGAKPLFEHTYFISDAMLKEVRK